jgi:hypothetical protein
LLARAFLPHPPTPDAPHLAVAPELVPLLAASNPGGRLYLASQTPIGTAPIQAYFGIADQRPHGNRAPRGLAGAPDIACPVRILFLDPESKTLPILAPAA